MEGGACKKQELSEMEFVRALGRFHKAHCFRVRRNPREILGTRQSSFRLPATGLGVKLLQPVALWAVSV